MKVTSVLNGKKEVFEVTEETLFTIKSSVLSNALLDLYFGVDNDGEVTVNRKKTFKSKVKHELKQ